MKERRGKKRARRMWRKGGEGNLGGKEESEGKEGKKERKENVEERRGRKFGEEEGISKKKEEW